MKDQSREICPPGDDKDRIDPLVWKIAAVVMLGPLMTTLDSTVVNVSLAALGRELHSPLATIQWVTSGYLLSLALMLPLSGWLVDRVGAKQVYLGCFAAFTLASLLCGMATSATSLILFRVLQGAAGGLLAPMAQMMMARVAGRHMARVMGLAVMPVMIGPVLGPALAGAIVQHASWPWIFYINLPIGLLAMTLAWRILPADSHETQPRSFDLLGFVLLSPALAMLLHSLESLGSGASNSRLSDIELAASVALLGAFLWHGFRRGKSALIDLHLFRHRTFSAAASTQFLGNGITLGGQLVFPLYLLMAGGQTPSGAGLLLASTGLGLLCAFPMVGRLTGRFGPRRVSSAGTLIALSGTLPFAFAGANGLPIAVVCLVLFVRGAGMGCINIPSISAAYASIPKEAIPVATTAINIVQRLGGPVATTLLAIYLHASMSVHKGDIPAAFASTFQLFCILHVLAFLAALRLPSGSVTPGLTRQAEAATFAESQD
jgi:EmrB/QacA subfamily drug resistance transporter